MTKAVFECELSDADLIELIRMTIGEEAPEYVPRAATLTLRDGDLAEFLKTLEPGRRGHLYECVARYAIYMDLVRTNSHYYPNLQTLILIGLIEFAMLGDGYLPLRNFLEKRTEGKGSTTNKELRAMLKEYSNQYGMNNTLVKFFEKYLGEEESEILAKTRVIPEWSRCDTMKRFVEKVAEYRHGFVHKLSRDAPWPFPQKIEFDEKMNIAGMVPTMSIDFLIPLIWKGILRKFGYPI